MVTTACLYCQSDNTIDPMWASINCWKCGANFVALAVRCDGPPPAGFERAATGACIRHPSLWQRSFGRSCPNCQRRGYMRDFGTVQTGQYTATRERWVTEHHYGPYGVRPEVGRTERPMFVPTTVREYLRTYACLWCGQLHHQAENEEL